MASSSLKVHAPNTHWTWIHWHPSHLDILQYSTIRNEMVIIKTIVDFIYKLSKGGDEDYKIILRVLQQHETYSQYQERHQL